MKRLKNILVINAVSSGATALLLIIFPGFFAELFGIEQQSPFIWVGIFLMLFASYVYFQSRENPPDLKKVKSIIVMDVSWVVGSLIIILPQLFNLTIIGYVMIGGVAMWVTAMAVLQLMGVKKLTSGF